MEAPPVDHPRAFLAHAERFKQVRKFADQLARDLRFRKIEVYIAREDPRPDELFPHKLAREIQGSHALVVIWTQSAHDSDWVSEEIAYARKAGRHVCLLRYRSVPLPEGWEKQREWVPMTGVTFPGGIWAASGPWLTVGYSHLVVTVAETMYRWAGLKPARPL